MGIFGIKAPRRDQLAKDRIAEHLEHVTRNVIEVILILAKPIQDVAVLSAFSPIDKPHLSGPI